MAKRDPERATRLTRAIVANELDAIVCVHPKSVLLLTGYWPIIGNSVAIAERDGTVTLLVPQDEVAYIGKSNADEIVPFEAKKSPLENIRPALEKKLGSFPFRTIGIEREPISEEATYIATTQYGCGLEDLIQEIAPRSSLAEADELLRAERAILTMVELERVRAAVAIAREAFEIGSRHVQPGTTEYEIAMHFEMPLTTLAAKYPDITRARGMVSCMSGERSGTAYGAFAMSSRRRLKSGEVALIHCNSHADGVWTDITRTYIVGTPSELYQRMYEATFAASEAGLGMIRPGIKAGSVDAAVRNVLSRYGFEKEIKHDAGHRVGFTAIDHNASPQLKKGSSDVLEAGMVINLEPGIYFEGIAGMRLCDMVLVTSAGAELLTPFERSEEAL